MFITPVSHKQLNYYVDYCNFNLDTISIEDGNELVRKMLRVPDIHHNVYNGQESFTHLLGAALHLAKGCDVSTAELMKIIKEYNAYYQRDSYVGNSTIT